MQNNLISALSVEQLMLEAECCLKQVMNTEKCSMFYLIESGQLRKFTQKQENKYAPIYVESRDYDLNVGIVGLVATTGQSLELDNHIQHPSFNYLVDIDTTLQSQTIPITWKNKIFGVYQVAKLSFAK